jgi:AraC-like DNA-binding protein
MNDKSTLLDTLTESDIYRDYERAYSDATGLPVALRGADAWQPSFRGKRRENSFCALMSMQNASCAACLRMQERMVAAASDSSAIARCHFGLTEVAVPVKLGKEILGFLATGQVFTQKPTETQYRKAARLMKRMGIKVNRHEAHKAYMATRVMPRNQLVSAARLLEIFADHLAMKSNQLVVRQANADPIAVVRAKAYIHEHLQDDITLTDVAKAACTSTFYICKLFKRHTGVNFTEYVSRIRIEKAREMLLNPNLRISEIAYDVGFQSLTHFNRVFRKLVGEAPTTYREKLALPLAA